MEVNAHAREKKNRRVTIIKKLICGWKLACTIARETMILIIVALWIMDIAYAVWEPTTL